MIKTPKTIIEITIKKTIKMTIIILTTPIITTWLLNAVTGPIGVHGATFASDLSTIMMVCTLRRMGV